MWQTKMLGPDMGKYVVVTTTESDEKGPKRRGAINGGFFPKKSDYPAQYPSVVIAVDDIDKSMKKVKDAGGTRPAISPTGMTVEIRANDAGRAGARISLE